MKNLNFLLRDKKAFTLLNIMIVILLLSITIKVSVDSFNFITLNTKSLNHDLELDNSIDYFYNYLNNELLSCDKIISTDEVKYYNNFYPNNIGFFILSRGDKIDEIRYTNYYLRSDGSLMRNSRSLNKQVNLSYKHFRSKQGDFPIIERLESISYDLDWKNSDIYKLKLNFKKDLLSEKTLIFNIKYLVVEDE